MAMITSLYRCANCGSKELDAYTENGKCRLSAFRLTKKEDIKEYRCKICGEVSQDCMSETEKGKLDMAILMQPAFREELREFARTYENIEIEPYTYALAAR